MYHTCNYIIGKSDGHEPHDEVTMSHSTSPVDQLSSNIHMTRAIAVRCVRTPKGSVVNFRACQNFIELI